MIRFCDRQYIDKADMDIVIAAERVVFDENIWSNGRAYFKHNLCGYDGAVVKMLPIEDKNQNVVCYAYQDDEANREVRMLRELEENENAMRFSDVFSDVREVVVCGCNELAYYFVRYLEKQQIPVCVIGKYWNCFGYENEGIVDLDGVNKLVVFAENIMPNTGSLYQRLIRSASPEFECIDRIYEANVSAGKIKDTEEDLEAVLETLKGKRIAILGIDEESQDTYDFLYQYGIDICYFVKWGGHINRGEDKCLLGKKIVDVTAAIGDEDDVSFVNGIDTNSALGTRTVDFFSYYGYERNSNFFLLRDYTDIPCTNLIHVLRGKTIWLGGEKRLCRMLSEYLEEIEYGDIQIKYAEAEQYKLIRSTDIFCAVYPWHGGVAPMEDNPRLWNFRQELLAADISYTDYFSKAKSFLLIDLHRCKNIEKFSIKQLTPKGILLGRIPPRSGNYFFRGILDGHPDILKWDYTPFDSNLWMYCIRLAYEKSENVLTSFKEMYMEESISWRGADFTDWDRFEEKVKGLLSLKECFTAQELFVIFYIVYAEMTRNEKIEDINQKILYWEPHGFPREDYPFLARWLEDRGINGQTVFMHRDHIVWTGSAYRPDEGQLPNISNIQSFSERILEEDNTAYQHWKEFHVRFEDIKLHPRKELTEICNRLGISWSDTMLRTTRDGEANDYAGISDFDLKPVFNKYEENLSEFDRFRISILCSAYQKKYGYTYENCMKFSRKELQEMFLKEFRFQQRQQFVYEKERNAYYIRAYESLRQQLWVVRRHAVSNDIIPQFEAVEIGEIRQVTEKTGIENVKKFVLQQERLILYGIGKDCEGILASLDETEQSKLVFCDRKAEGVEMVFHGKKVISPKELCEAYKEYPIFVTSSYYYKSIQYQLMEMGISSERITCNKSALWERK